MYFEGCESLALSNPSRRGEITQIDNLLSQLQGGASIDANRVARFLKISEISVQEILELLVRHGVIRKHKALHCRNCDSRLPPEQHTHLWDHGEPASCTSCGSELDDRNSNEVDVYRVAQKAQTSPHTSDSSQMATTTVRPPTAAPSTNTDDPPVRTARALLLSGGGYRAALFHIGVLRWLYEHSASNEQNHPLLANVQRVIGISGGSFTAAHFALNRDLYLNNFTTAVQPLLDFIASNDIRRLVLKDRKDVADLLLPLLGDKSFATISNIDLTILGTCLKSGDCVSFSKDGVSRWYHELSSPNLTRRGENSSGQILLRYAIKASSAFPPVFSPLQLNDSMFIGVAKQKMLASLAGTEVVDGGVRDNLGIEYAMAQPWGQNHTDVLISDAGRLFDWDNHSFMNEGIETWARRLMRIIDIQMYRSALLDINRASKFLRIDISGAEKASVDENMQKSAYAQPLTLNIASKAADVPTDLISLNKSEVYSIIRLGYDITACICASSMSPHTFAGHVDGNFWQTLYPNDIDRLMPGNKRNKCLVEHVRGKEVPVEGNVRDIIQQLPIEDWQKHLLESVATRANRTTTYVLLAAALLVVFGLGMAFHHFFFTTVPKG